MFTLGGTELLLIGALVLLLFGPDKIPQVARTVGRFMREFNKYKDIMESSFRSEMEAAEKKDAEKTASGDGAASDLDRLTQAAQASRDFAAEHGTEIPEASEIIGGGGPAPDPDQLSEAEAARPTPATVTDEDEEEG